MSQLNHPTIGMGGHTFADATDQEGILLIRPEFDIDTFGQHARPRRDMAGTIDIQL